MDKIDGLVKMADGIIEVINGDKQYISKDSTDQAQFLAEAQQFILDLYGKDSPMYLNYLSANRRTFKTYASLYAEVKGVLLAVRNNIDQGWLDNVRNELSAEIFDDYLEMASYLNSQGFYIAAAVIAGTTLEERLRQLCTKNGLPVEKADAKGEMKPIKAENLNSSLVTFYIDGKADSKLVTANYGLRNHAAHAEWNNDPPEKKDIRIAQVELMISQIKHFIKTNPI
ncbi:MAG TPA: hypothetical protein VIM07_07045 [Chitinophagaceae bacterium]